MLSQAKKWCFGITDFFVFLKQILEIYFDLLYFFTLSVYLTLLLYQDNDDQYEPA